MKKVLFVASVAGHIRAFHLPYLKWFKEQNFVVDVAAGGDGEVDFTDKKYDLLIKRNPFSKDNIKAYIQLKKIIDEGNYSLIHCHTPVAAFLTRIAAQKTRKKETKVVYTAHGFHFFKGAPIINWLVYFSIEWLCSFFTDVLITINLEDYSFAKKHLHAKNIEYVPGVGINTAIVFNSVVDKTEKRRELGLPENDTVLLSVGELNDNKNHEVVIRAISELGRDDITYAICGNGKNKESLEKLAKELKIEHKVHLLGFRTDVIEIYKCSDIFVFPSKREGLPVSVLEAMAAGLPCVVSKIRGNVDIIKDSSGGYLFSPDDTEKIAETIDFLAGNNALRENMGRYNMQEVCTYDIENVKKKMTDIYLETLESI